MTKAEIILKAQLYLDDTSGLSTTEFGELFDKMYRQVNSDRPWEGTKKEGTGTTSTTLPYIDLASDFLFLTANYNHTDASEAANRPVVFRGTAYTPYEVVSWSDRRQYRNTAAAYIDWTNARLYFTKQPTVAEAVEYDYHGQKAVLAVGESPWFPADYHDVLVHMIVADDFIIQQSPKAKSYRDENLKVAKNYMEGMAWWNSQLVQI